jgi:hypothetical protein
MGLKVAAARLDLRMALLQQFGARRWIFSALGAYCEAAHGSWSQRTVARQSPQAIGGAPHRPSSLSVRLPRI